jgi:hypothetical protein
MDSLCHVCFYQLIVLSVTECCRDAVDSHCCLRANLKNCSLLLIQMKYIINILMISLLIFSFINGKCGLVHVDYSLHVPGLEGWFLFYLKQWQFKRLYYIK